MESGGMRKIILKIWKASQQVVQGLVSSLKDHILALPPSENQDYQNQTKEN
jgi:hypothetical protein